MSRYHDCMRFAYLCVLLIACGDDKAARPDASHLNGDARSDAAPLTLDCTSYCTAITQRCTGQNQQYASSANCLDSCADLMAGALTDTMGNTLGCRVYHVELALSDPGTHCVHAGPSGGATCGTTCQGFCAIATAECPTQWSANTCANQCSMVATSPPYSSSATGNTIECRLLHATQAATDPTTECPNTVKNQNPVCQ